MSAGRAPVHEPTAPAGSVGHRIVTTRELVGLTRFQVAARAGVSRDLLAQIERGDVPPAPSVTAATARALGLDVDSLYGQPYGPTLGDPILGDPSDGVPALRLALDSDDDPQPTGPPLTAAALRARLDDCDRYRAEARYAQLGAALPELLHHGHALSSRARPGAEAETSWALLTDACQLAETVAYRFGYLDLAMLCHFHARSAAAKSGNPVRAAVVACAHIRLRCHRGDYPGAARLAERAHAEIAEQTSPAADSVRTQLHLRQAITQARAGDAGRAGEHLDAARGLLTRPIPPSPYYTVQASATNVDIHWVAVAVELAEAGTALDRAGHVKIPTGEPPASLGRYLIDLARAHALHGDHGQALDTLQRARALAPQLVRYHPQARETLHFLAETERRDTDSPAGFARWAGIAPENRR